ncbi:MAG: hypothetical protein IPO08_15500 [Xanthomonadales bacterium]|nr:hypothetical protein [Xanthomonadales bacterium]
MRTVRYLVVHETRHDYGSARVARNSIASGAALARQQVSAADRDRTSPDAWRRDA